MRQLGWVVALAVSLVAQGARADDDENARHEAAKALVAQGTALYGQAAYAEALKKFRDAYEVFPNPKIFFDIGQASAHLNDRVAAANAFQSFLDQTLEATDIAAERSAAHDQLSKLTAKLGRLVIAPTPADAQVLIDGETVAERATFVQPGSHRVAVSRDGYATSVQDVEVHAAENRNVPVVLEAEAKPEERAVTTPPLVVHDVPDVAPPPVTLSQPAPTTAQPAGGLTASPPRRHATASYALLAGGGAGVVAGAVFGLLAFSDNSHLHDLVGGKPGSGAPSDAPGLRDSIQRESLISTVAIALGAAAVGAGAFLFFTSDAPAAETRAPAPNP